MSYKKYYLYKKQVSTDGGQTWEDVQPIETIPSGDPISDYDSKASCQATLGYLTFVAQESGTFSFIKFGSGTMQYSLDSGYTWTSISGQTPTVQSGDTVMWKGNMIPNNPDKIGIGYFSSSGRFTVEGNVMSLLYDDNFEGQTSLSGKSYVFYELFIQCSGLISAENLSLPATTLADSCYEAMFVDCSGLTTPPKTIGTEATTLATNCYDSMFVGCTSLTTVPDLPATTLAYGCYGQMFRDCSGLTTVPDLPATTLAYGCYWGMFAGCRSLATVPSDLLPATTMAQQCYTGMFAGCASLTTPPQLPATTLAYGCYEGMFQGCTSLTTAPDLLVTTLADSCYNHMFYGCSNLNYIKCLATNISARYCTSRWVEDAASTGTFVKAASMTDWSSGVSGIPSGWTVQNA